jgi:hypothetical protein
VAFALVLGVAFLLSGESPIGHALYASFGATVGFAGGTMLDHTVSFRGRSLSRKDRREVLRCVRRGLAPGDLRLAPAVIDGAARVSSPWVGAGVWPSVWGTWIAVLSATALACAWSDDMRGAVFAALGALYATMGLWVTIRRQPQIRRNAAVCLEATLTATAQPG